MTSPRLARIAALFYLLTFFTAAPLLAVLFYRLFKPVNKTLSLAAAFFSPVGYAIQGSGDRRFSL
jgi:Domain of unknown function (DUF4386)